MPTSGTPSIPRAGQSLAGGAKLAFAAVDENQVGPALLTVIGFARGIRQIIRNLGVAGGVSHLSPAGRGRNGRVSGHSG